MRRTCIAAMMMVAATPAAAQNFTCTNQKAQISCADGACEVNTDGFTPMSLSRDGARLEICAYTGCWGGPILVRRSRDGIDLLYARVRNTTGTGGNAAGMGTLAVIYDGGSKTAQMRWGAFANSMSCGSGR